MEEPQKIINLRGPVILPSNGRIVLQAVEKAEKKKGLLYIPVKKKLYDPRKPEREVVQEDNPQDVYDYYAVAMAPEVNEQMRLANGMKLELGDRVIISSNFSCIRWVDDEQYEYFLIHWQDTLGVIKQTTVKEQSFPDRNIVN